MEYILIIFMSIGALSDKDSMAITHIEFQNLQECQKAGQQAIAEFGAGTKVGKFVCVQRSKAK